MKKFAIAGFLSLALTTGNVMAASPFEDIDPSHWAYPKIKFLYDHGIIRGTGEGKFDGNERISRYEAAALVYQSLQYVNRTRSQGGAIDADIMDTINSLMTELTDEMQVIEVRIEENSDAIAMLRNHIASMHGKPTQGVTVPMGQGRLKFMGQTMVSLVSGGSNSAYSAAWGSNNNTAAPVNPREGSTEFTNDYIMLGLAADIDERTSFFAKANVYTGNDAVASAVNGNIPGVNPANQQGGMTGLNFNDYMYLHVKDLWADWDLTLGRMGLPWGHETGGAFRTNPYFVTNSLVDMLYNNRLVTGAYVSTDSDSGEWNWGLGVHNGDQSNPSAGFSHLYPGTAMVGSNPYGANQFGINGFTNFPVMAADTSTANGVNSNEDNSFGFLLHLGHRTADGDLRWDVNYFMNGGSNTGNTGALVGQMAMNYFNVGADYRINEDWAVSGEFVSGTVESANVNALLGIDRGLGANSQIAEDSFTTYYLQLLYNLDHKSTLALRLGDHSYEGDALGGIAAGADTGLPDDSVTEMALAYSRKVSDNGTLLLEYSDVDWDLQGGFNKSVCEAAGASCMDEFEVIRASYRVDF